MVLSSHFSSAWLSVRLSSLFAVVECGLTGSVALQLVADVYNINPAPHYAIFNGLLLFLFGLHLYW